MKKLTTLLAQRPSLLRQLRVANLAYAYATLTDLQQRLRRAGVTGRMVFQSADSDEERYAPTLTADQAAGSVIEEHFSDELLLNLSDVLAFLAARDTFTIEFEVDEIEARFIAPVREELERAGVEIDGVCELSVNGESGPGGES